MIRIGTLRARCERIDDVICVVSADTVDYYYECCNVLPYDTTLCTVRYVYVYLPSSSRVTYSYGYRGDPKQNNNNPAVYSIVLHCTVLYCTSNSGTRNGVAVCGNLKIP